ncbi:putative phage protein gp47/JayE [Elusimicrobium simillimum]|uniref:baseplate J/gp47 family protein n=1 Tax=Elusimicrobium simillimum TaxID=3143438 RepID=UPI003C6F582C
MPNTLDANGLQIKTLSEIKDEISADLREIYGQDINLDSNSPDGQVVNIFAQAAEDNLELIQEVCTSFDPDLAVGRILDQRCAINGIQRRVGTYTHVNIAIVCDRSLNLTGLNTSSEEEAFTISDNEGNQFILESTVSLDAGTSIQSFRAKEIGQVEVLPNTITTAVTIVLGVLSLNNTGPAVTTGTNEETDSQLRARRSIAVSLGGKGFLDNLRSALNALEDVASAQVYNNRGTSEDADGIPAHGIWAIVDGGTDEAIADIMDAKMGGGNPMKGSVSIPVLQTDSSYDTYSFDRPITQPLYINLNIKGIDGQAVPQDYIKSQLVSRLSYKVAQTADAGTINCLTLDIMPNIAVNSTVSNDNTTFGLTAATLTKQHKFVVSADNINITVVS